MNFEIDFYRCRIKREMRDLIYNPCICVYLLFECFFPFVVGMYTRMGYPIVPSPAVSESRFRVPVTGPHHIHGHRKIYDVVLLHTR